MATTTQLRVDNSLEETKPALDRFLPPNDEATFHFAICLKETGELVGLGGCHGLAGTFGWPIIGYMFRKEFWGQGLATEFLRAWLGMWCKLPREEAEIDVDPRTVPDGGGLVPEQVTALVILDNVGSQGVLKKRHYPSVLGNRLDYAMQNTSWLNDAAAKLTLKELEAARAAVGDFKENGYAVTGFRYPLDRPLFYVKRRHPAGLYPEARTQEFARTALDQMAPAERSGIYVPRVLRVMEREDGNGFIVMEYIHGRTLKELFQDNPQMTEREARTCFDKISRALRLFLAAPVPAGARPGPCGGGIIGHPLFNDFVAPIEYTSVDMLEQHLNRVATFRVRTAPTLTLERDLHLVYADLHTANFVFTRSGDLYVIDFDMAAFLPLSFMTFALRFPTMMSGAVAAAIAKDFDDLAQQNFEIMLRVADTFGRGSNNIGLPLDRPLPTRSTRLLRLPWENLGSETPPPTDLNQLDGVV
ncbi:Acyl-CoA N-acyltransferase [Niveomyces insectorum RCEF 264]|uniref:Bifunctional AAC/APH n=1 Tax=Niveomyces insectorum RCEF 264 TaxID=1081102 RepID=A0A167UPM6_9HYPO|nr:Acyl-CoA N-acyltransferase [Niveomyces insectorum RCEF 264]